MSSKVTLKFEAMRQGLYIKKKKKRQTLVCEKHSRMFYFTECILVGLPIKSSWLADNLRIVASNPARVDAFSVSTNSPTMCPTFGDKQWPINRNKIS